MSEVLGQVSCAEERSPFLGQADLYVQNVRDYSEETAAKIDAAVRELVEAAFEKATAVLETHWQTLDETAKLLLERETLDADELPSLQPYESISSSFSTARRYHATHQRVSFQNEMGEVLAGALGIPDRPQPRAFVWLAQRRSQ